jgi:hypothetical protein
MDRLTQELWRIVGGDFTPDSLGPERYDAHITRIRERPGLYLDTFESMFLGSRFDAELQSEIHAEALLRVTAEADPDRTRDVAERLLTQLESPTTIREVDAKSRALSGPYQEEAINVERRLEQRRAQLRSLLS